MRHLSFRPSVTMRGRKNKGLRGLAGKPLHPPLTDVPITAYLFAAVFDVLSIAVHSSHPTSARQLFVAGTWTLLGGAAVSLLTALTGAVDWGKSEPARHPGPPHDQRPCAHHDHGDGAGPGRLDRPAHRVPRPELPARLDRGAVGCRRRSGQPSARHSAAAWSTTTASTSRPRATTRCGTRARSTSSPRTTTDMTIAETRLPIPGRRPPEASTSPPPKRPRPSCCLRSAWTLTNRACGRRRAGWRRPMPSC